MTAFSSEAELCSAFVALIGDQWTAYAETAGFDLLLVRNADGAQIGVEAKLALNVKVMCQILPDGGYWREEGPDYRAVLVPSDKAQNGLGLIARHLGVTVLRLQNPDKWYRHARVDPQLPREGWSSTGSQDWHEWAPMRRCALPDYVPDVTAGRAAPVALTAWKVKAIKIAIILESRPVTRADFKTLQIDPSRWTDRYTGWLQATPEGYVAGPGIPDFKAQHPVNYEQIKADAAKWMPPPGRPPARAGQGVLLPVAGSCA